MHCGLPIEGFLLREEHVSDEGKTTKWGRDTHPGKKVRGGACGSEPHSRLGMHPTELLAALRL